MPAGGTVLVALSGGVDSVVLLHLLHEFRATLGLTLHAAHLNHKLRPEADADQAFCEALCARLGVPLTTRGERPDAPGESPQAAARTLRYRFLDQVAQAVGADVIATAHHRDDVAETLVMRLVTGAGTTGLSAMAPRRGNRVRPLLWAAKNDLIAHAAHHGLGHVEDASNAEPRYLRNRIRQRVMPELAALNPAIGATLAREAALLGDVETYLSAQVAPHIGTLIHRDGVHLVIDRLGVARLPAALAQRVVHGALVQALTVPPGAAHVLAVVDLATGPAGRRVTLPGGVVAVAEYRHLRLGAPAQTPHADPIPLNLPGVTDLPWAGMRLQAAVAPAREAPVSEGWLHLDSARAEAELIVRGRRPGDRFAPEGMGGHSKKLKDYLIDCKVPRGERDRVALLTCGDDICWVVGMRADHRFAVSGADPGQRVLAIRILPR